MRRKAVAADACFHAVNCLAFTLFTVICVLPFYYLFINTISDNSLVARGAILLIPKGIHFNNYLEILKMRGLADSALVSVSRTAVGTVLTVIGTSFLGYAFTRQELWHRKIWYRLIIATMYFNAGIIPWYTNMKNLGLLNNFFAYILPAVVSPFSLILFKTYVESSVPGSLEESADMDGAGYLRKFFVILLPICKPIVATIAVFSAVAQWNAFTDTLFLMTDSKLYPLQFLLYRYLSEANALAAALQKATSTGVAIDPSRLLTPTSVKMTVSLVITVPILLVYPLFQRYFVSGITLGAVKG